MRLALILSILIGVNAEAQSVLSPALFTALPAGATQKLIGTYSGDCPDFTANCTLVGGDEWFRGGTLFGVGIDEAGTVFRSKWLPSTSPSESGWMGELWSIPVDGSPRKLLDLPHTVSCTQIDAHTLKLTGSRVLSWAYYATDRPKKMFGFIVQTERYEETITFQMWDGATCANPNNIIEIPQRFWRITDASIAVEIPR
jgi:hypothetical protein